MRGTGRVIAGTVVAVIALGGWGSAAWAGSSAKDDYVDLDDEPCGIVSAADVEAALGITDADGVGVGSDVGTASVCTYGQSPGATFQISNQFGSDGGKTIKELCKTAKTATTQYTDYAKLKGVGKVGCTYTASTFGRNPAPVMLLFALSRGSDGSGRRLQLSLVGTPEVLAPYEPRIDAGFLGLAKKAAALIKDNFIN